MFSAIARFDIRFRWLIIGLWIAAVLVAGRALPSLSSVTSASNAGFLSADAASQQAAALAAPFQGASSGATAILVAARAGTPLTAADNSAIDRVEQAVGRIPGVTLVRDQGVSSDGQARRALVVTSDPSVNNGGDPTLIGRIRATFGSAAVASGLAIHLTGPLAAATDAASSASQTGTNIRLLTVLFVVVLLFLVFRSVLGPLVTLLPAVLSLLLAEPLIAGAAGFGLPVSPATATLLPVLLLGAGADYGLFLVFRMREEVRRGAAPHDALIIALGRVGQSITYSAGTVIVALCCLLVASFGLYRGLGPSLALGVAVLLLSGLTLLPALLAVFGDAVFWPARPMAGEATTGAWGRLAARVIQRPVAVLLSGVALFVVLGAGLAGFRTAGFTSGSIPSSSDSAAGAAVLAAHYPAASANAETFVLRFGAPVWDDPTGLAAAEASVASSPDVHAVSGPLDPNGTILAPADLTRLHASLGPPQGLAGHVPASVSPALFAAYKAAGQYLSADGRTVELSVVPAAGPAGSRAAIGAIPALRTLLTRVAQDGGATASGIAGQDATAADISAASRSDLVIVVPVVLAAIALLLALLLRSLVAPIYLIATVGLSYVAALGFATIVFVGLGGADGLNFLIPILLFIFAMALGEDYNILLMTRLREEAEGLGLPDALTRAVGRTGGTITSAGVILAGTFSVLAIAGGSDQARQLGFTIAFGILLDTFFVRTLLVPAIATLLGRWNWWPSTLSRPAAGPAAPETGGRA
jgi:putative drug exporter of the RND superfamily